MPPRKRQAAPDEPLAVLHQRVSLVEVAESWLLDMIMADQVAARMVAARLSDTVAVVVPEQVDALLLRLRKLGHTPKVTGPGR